MKNARDCTVQNIKRGKMPLLFKQQTGKYPIYVFLNRSDNSLAPNARDASGPAFAV